MLQITTRMMPLPVRSAPKNSWGEKRKMTLRMPRKCISQMEWIWETSSIKPREWWPKQCSPFPKWLPVSNSASSFIIISCQLFWRFSVYFLNGSLSTFLTVLGLLFDGSLSTFWRFSVYFLSSHGRRLRALSALRDQSCQRSPKEKSWKN